MAKEIIEKQFNWMKYRAVYTVISLICITIGLGTLFTSGLKLGVDFSGGAVLEYSFVNDISTEEASQKIQEKDITVSSVQKVQDKTYLFKLQTIAREQEGDISNILKELSKGEVTLNRFDNVGPTIGPELLKKTLYAVVIAAITILLWIAYQFRSIKFGLSATVATIHDALILIGSFALLSKYFGAEADFLFVTAVLTTLSFSVHDTIVVFDRIREIRRKNGGDIKDIANKALSETMRRSIANSLTIIFMLLALIVLGGSSTQWFAVALLIGTISGTYSSPFIAVPLLVTWDEALKRLRK